MNVKLCRRKFVRDPARAPLSTQQSPVNSVGVPQELPALRAVAWYTRNGCVVRYPRALVQARLVSRASEVKELAFAHTGPLEGFGPLATFASRQEWQTLDLP